VFEPETCPAPLDRLHGLGIDETEQPATVDYRAFGIEPEDIPTLIIAPISDDTSSTIQSL
jgi:hypothetical protein